VTEPKKFVSEDPDLEAKPFPMPLEYRRFTGPEDPETGLRPSERTTETFICRPYVNAGVLVWFDALLTKNGPDNGPTPVFDLFDAALLPTSAVRFREIINSPDAYVTGKVLGEMAMELHEVYTARPTQPPAGT
jgi:hypothetical protein